MFESLSWGSPGWLLPAAALLAAALAALWSSYRAGPAPPAVRASAAFLKALGIAALAFCLVEPLRRGQRPRPGANIFAILVDNSESLSLRDRGENRSRGEALRELLRPDAAWRARLGQDFDVRQYIFDGRLQAVEECSELALDGRSTALATCLDALADRYRGRPLSGVLLFTDGNATDLEGRAIDGAELPPVYPVLAGEDGPPRDLAVGHLSVTETHFESAPTLVQAEILHCGFEGEEIIAELLDESDVKVGESAARADETGRLTARFELRPEGTGVRFYRARVSARREIEQFAAGRPVSEATLANNSRLVAVDRSRGPYRILYVCGRPNWEFKFLRRAVEEDEELEVIGLVRIAKREPKFDYRSRYGEATNPLFRGFEPDEEDAERYDQPVFLRVGTIDPEELRDGFPKAADQLFGYDGVILDDVEAEYFTRGQMALLHEFVSRRGGGLLMLGGQESFTNGGYRRTPVGDLLPVYLDEVDGWSAAEGGYRFQLSREGRVLPWIRLRSTEEEEERRIDAMPPFLTLNPARGIKPGAAVLARAVDARGDSHPALVEQRFGRGRTAAILIGDLWRWALRRRPQAPDDQAQAWRQILRWLVAEAPRRVEADVRAAPDGGESDVEIAVKVTDEAYEPLDNASVMIEVTVPEGSAFELAAEPSARESGLYEARCTLRHAGAYRGRVSVRAPDGSALDGAEIGWTSEPAAREYRALRPDRELLERLAREAGGEMVDAARLNAFVAGLSARRRVIVDPWVYPLWHRWSVFLFAVLCLSGEWALRRWRGLP